MAHYIKNINLKLPISSSVVFRDHCIFSQNFLSERGIGKMRSKLDTFLLKKELDKFTKNLFVVNKPNKKLSLPILTKINFNKPPFNNSPKSTQYKNIVFRKEKKNTMDIKKNHDMMFTPKLSRQNSTLSLFHSTKTSTERKPFFVLSPVNSHHNLSRVKIAKKTMQKSNSVSHMFENEFIKQQMLLKEKNK